MTIQLATVNLQVTDPAQSRRFYQDLLGMVENPQRSHPPTFVYLESPRAALTLTTPVDAPAATPSPTMELGFEVDDLPTLRTHLDRLGVRDLREQSMGWGDAIELRDPDGYRVVAYSFRRRPEAT